MTAKIAYAESMTSHWFNGDMQAVIAHRISFDFTECAQLWERVAEGKRRDG